VKVTAEREVKVKRVKMLATALAAVALMALTGAASASAASGFISDSTTGATHLLSNSPSKFQFNTSMGNQNCWGIDLTGTMEVPTENLSLSDDGECSLGAWKMNGCKITFQPGQGTFAIGPANCGPIVVGTTCQVSIGYQNGLKASYENWTPAEWEGTKKWVNVKAEVNNLKYTQTKCNEGKGLQTNGVLTGTWQLKGYGNASHTEPVNLRVGGANGLYIGGSPAKLEAETYDAAIVSKQSTAFEFGISTGKIRCLTLAGANQIAGSASSFSLKGLGYTSCAGFAGFTVKVTSNSCSYGFEVANSGPPYTGTQSLNCGEKGLEAAVMSGGEPRCIVSIPTQTLAAIGYENIGSGSSREVVANTSGEGKTYTVSYPKGESVPTCGKSGTYNNGTVAGAITLYSFG
jgi:hypothetical protein